MSKLRDAYNSGMILLRRAFMIGPHTCPWWFGYSFDNPVRRFVHDPAEILGGLVEPGQTVVDIGCGLGYFSLALAELVGPDGRVIALDVQQQVIRRALHRAERRGLADRIDFRTCAPDRLAIDGSVDFALAFWMLHEVADPGRFLAEVHSILLPEGNFLIAEPKGHVSAAHFEATVELARRQGFEVSGGPQVRFSRSAICSSPRRSNATESGPV